MSGYCSQTLSGIGVTCNSLIGGVSAVYIANRNDVTDVTMADTITKITMADGAKFSTYLHRKNASVSMSSDKGGDDASGTHLITTNISLVFAGMDTDKRKEVDALLTGQFVVVVKDRNGKYWMPIVPPADDYMSASAGNATTGATSSEANGYTLTLTGEASHLPIEVEASTMTSIINPL
jgi:hypothetical protein